MGNCWIQALLQPLPRNNWSLQEARLQFPSLTREEVLDEMEPIACQSHKNAMDDSISEKKKQQKTAERNDCKELFVGHWTPKMSIPVQSLACLLVLPNCLGKRHSSTRKPCHSYVLRTSQVDTCNKTPRRQYCGGTCLRMSQTSTQSLRMELTPSTSTD